MSLQIRVGIGDDSAKAETIKIGRAEIEIRGDTALVMNKPERFRYELIDVIVKDSKRLMDEIDRRDGADCKVEIDGLNRRVEWERASAAELLMYIRYSVTISDCRKSSQ